MKKEEVEKLERSDFAQLVRDAIEKVGGLRELSRQLDWHSGAISEVLAGKVRLPPYRAGQCAALLGADPDEWIFDSLRQGAKTEGERAYWFGRWHHNVTYGGIAQRARDAHSADELAAVLLHQLIVDSPAQLDREYWKTRLNELQATRETAGENTVALLIDALLELEQKLSAMKYKPNPAEKAKMIGELVRLALMDAQSPSAGAAVAIPVSVRKKAS